MFTNVQVSKCTRDCDLGPGWHIHFPEGRITYLTPKQREAMRESIREARRRVDKSKGKK